MIAIDTNIFIHLLVRSQEEHSKAVAWLEKNDEALSTTATNIGKVLRLLTHPRVFPKPMALVSAIDLLKKFMETWQVRLLEESEDWWLDLKDLAEELKTLRGNEVFDARMALCLKHNGIKKICTLDDDFSKYSFLEIIKI